MPAAHRSDKIHCVNSDSPIPIGTEAIGACGTVFLSLSVSSSLKILISKNQFLKSILIYLYFTFSEGKTITLRYRRFLNITPRQRSGSGSITALRSKAQTLRAKRAHHSPTKGRSLNPNPHRAHQLCGVKTFTNAWFNFIVKNQFISFYLYLNTQIFYRAIRRRFQCSQL